MWQSWLKSVNWGAIGTAHGTASEVPDALMAICSDDANERKAAYWKLDNHIVLQSDLYEASYYVVPFLVEMIREGAERCCSDVYNLLFEIANGYAPPSVQCKKSNGQYVSLVDGCLEEVKKGIELYQRDLTNTDPRICQAASDLLTLLQSK